MMKIFYSRILLAPLLGTLLISCGPQKNALDGFAKGTATTKVGCGPKTGIVMDCTSVDSPTPNKINLDVTLNCSEDQEIQSVNVNTDLGGTGLTCAVSNPLFLRQSTWLNSITASGAAFASDAGLKELPADKELEWSCTENYQDDPSRDFNRSYHFITFRRTGSTVYGKLENRNEYVDYDLVSQTGSSTCSFSYQD